jgi:hypothetical protein
MFRYLVVEYYYKDESAYGKKNVLGSYKTPGEARKAAGIYITENVKTKRMKYRDWYVRVLKDRIYFDIR